MIYLIVDPDIKTGVYEIADSWDERIKSPSFLKAGIIGSFPLRHAMFGCRVSVISSKLDNYFTSKTMFLVFRRECDYNKFVKGLCPSNEDMSDMFFMNKNGYIDFNKEKFDRIEDSISKYSRDDKIERSVHLSRPPLWITIRLSENSKTKFDDLLASVESLATKGVEVIDDAIVVRYEDEVCINMIQYAYGEDVYFGRLGDHSSYMSETMEFIDRWVNRYVEKFKKEL